MNNEIKKRNVKYGRVLIVGNDEYMYSVEDKIAEDVLTIGINRIYYLFWPDYIFFTDMSVLREIDSLNCEVPKTTTFITTTHQTTHQTNNLIKKYNVITRKPNYINANNPYTLLHILDTIHELVVLDKTISIYFAGIALNQSQAKYAFYKQYANKELLKNQLVQVKKLKKKLKKKYDYEFYKTNEHCKINCELKNINELYNLPINVIHIKRTNLAQAPNSIDHVLRFYTPIQSKLVYIENGDANATKKILNRILKHKVNILHFHNKYIPNKQNNKTKPWPNVTAELIQYHSPTEYVHLDVPKHVKQYVLNQLHCTMKEYKHLPILMNPIVTSLHNSNRSNNKIRIVYSPSVVVDRPNPLSNKGFTQTSNILNKIKNKIKNKSVEIDIIYNTPHHICMFRKSMATIIIDECVTGGFHKSSLEGLSLGKVVIAYLSDELKEKHPNLPIISTHISKLENTLQNLINKGKTELEKQGKENKEWFEKNWSNKVVAKYYQQVYEKLIATTQSNPTQSNLTKPNN